MITSSEHMETTLPSSCSSTSSSCSSASSTNSSSISTLSSTQGTASSSTNSTSSSPSTSHHHHHHHLHQQQTQHANFLNKQEQLAFDFHLIMNDLKSVCGTLSVLARQIDQIVNKMDDKFNLIVENLNTQQENESKSTRTAAAKTSSTKLSDLIKCANLSSTNEPIYSNSSKLSPSSSTGLFYSSNPSTQTTKTSKSSKTTIYSNPNEALLTSLINENYAAILNNRAGGVNRTFSDRKPLYFTNHAINDDLKKSFNFSLSKQQETQPLAKTTNSNQSSLNKTRCIRSKSQPAFVKTENIDYHSFLLNNANKITTTTTKNIIDNNNNNTNSTTDETKTIESSFYEDQLDNELEGFENSSKALLTNLSNKFTNKKDVTAPNGTINSIINATNSITDQSASKTMTPNLKQAGRTKSSNSNHHVSFNLNNAIYSSRQETPVPIPISILKNSAQANKLASVNPGSVQEKTPTLGNDSKYPNLSNGPLNLLSFPSSLQSVNTSVTNSPGMQQQQPSLSGSLSKKASSSQYANPTTILISEQQQQNLQQLVAAEGQPLRSLINSTNSNSNLMNSKQVRIDSKTTIL